MSLTPTAPRVAGPAPTLGEPMPGTRRVREQARDVLALMAFSALSSVAIAAGFLLLAQLGR
jgi:hypothetical protein